MKRDILAVTVVALLLILGEPVGAQDCGNGLPCGPLPWRLPNLPRLRTPTPMPTISFNPTPPPTATPAPTDTPSGPTPTATLDLDTSGIANQIATLNAVIEQTPMIVLDMAGTPVDTSAQFAELGDNAGLVFGYARGLSQASLGSISPLVAFTLTALVVVIAVKMLTFMWPILAALWNIISRIIQLVLDFLPF